MAQNSAMTTRATQMKRATIAALLIAALVPQSSFADALPAPAPTSLDDYRVALDQFKAARETFAQTLRLRDQQIRSINATFKAAVDKATRDAKVALASAKTPEEKTAIVTARQSAIASAISARDSAIAALPDPGPPPMEPIRPEPQQAQKMQPMKTPPVKGKDRRDGKGRN